MIKVYAALYEDINSGWIWQQGSELPQRSVVRIRNAANGKSVHCETLQIDENFLARYNQPPRSNIVPNTNVVIMNEWYRTRLGCPQTFRDYDLNIQPANCLWGKFWACIEHPQIIIRFGMWLGFIGVILGIVGVILTIQSML